MKRKASAALAGLFTLAVCGCICAQEPEKCSITKKEDKGKTVYILENSHLQAIVNPANGGGIDKLTSKPAGTKLTIPLGETDGQPSFMDRVFCQYPGTEKEADKTVLEVEYFVEYPYDAEIIKDTPEEAALKVSCRSRSERMNKWFTISKIYSLKKNESGLGVEYLLENSSAKPERAGVWIVTFLRTFGDMFPERNSFYSPTTNGITRVTHPGKDVSQQGDWVVNPAMSWKAIIGDSTRKGVVAVLDYQYLSCFYDWYLTSGFISTFEWAMREQEIPAKGKFSTKCTLIPVSEFARVDGVIGGKIAAAVNLPDRKLKAGEEAEVKVALNAIVPIKLKMISRLAGAEGAKELAQKEIELKAGITLLESLSIKPDKDGAYKLEVELVENGKPMGKAARAFAVGNAEADERRACPDIPKTGNEFLYPVIHLFESSGGKGKVKFKTAALAAGAAGADKKKEKAGPAKLDSKEQCLKNYPCLDYYFDISAARQTPHFQWLKPAAAGKLKVLYCDYMKYVTHTSKRQVIEFAQRMDLDYKFLPILKRMTSHSSNLGMNSGDAYADDLEQYIVEQLNAEAEKDYRVIVVQALDFKGVQKEVAEKLLAEVNKGKGLVLLNCNTLPPEVEKALNDGKIETPANLLSIPKVITDRSLLKTPACRLAALGKGRIAALDMPAANIQYPNYYGCELPFWEYAHLPAMRAMLWAGGVKPEAALAKLAWQDGALQAEINCAAGQNAAFEATFRDEYNRVNTVKKKDLKLKAGKNEIKVDLPKMAGGLGLADCRLLNKKGAVLDFGSVSFTAPEQAAIREIVFDKECYRSGEEISVKAALSNITASCKLVAEVEDTHSRKVKRVETDLAAGQTEAQLKFKLDHPLTILHRLFVRVEQDGAELARKMGEFSYPFNYPADDELMAYVWYGQALGFKLWADSGFDCMIFSLGSGGSSGMIKAFCNMNLKPYCYGGAYVAGDPGHKYAGDVGTDLIRQPCFSDPELWKKTREKCLDLMKKDRHLFYGVRDYQLCDELALGGKVCFSPYCLADFRKCLQEQYKSLEALNKEWESNFKDWAEVRPITLNEVREEKSNLPQWLDHRLFMNGVFANWVARHKEIAREAVPDAKMGLSGTQNPGITYDWWKLMKHMDSLANYGGIQCDLVTSFQIPGARSGQWCGGYASTEKEAEPYERYYPWAGILNGNTAYFFFHGSADGTTLLGDLRFTPNGQLAVEEVRELKSGTAKMLFSSERLVDGIGVHYSQSSMFSAMAAIGREYWVGAVDSWKYLINDLGLNFSFVSYEQLAGGKLSNEKYKIFILPVSLSLSANEVSALRDYVKNGGILIADYAPGLYDEHGRKCANDGLLELFGVKRGKENRVSIGECRLQVKPAAGEGIHAHAFPARFGEEGIELTTGKAYGETGKTGAPALIFNKFGNGRSILLNCVFSDYAKINLGGEGGETSSLSRGDPKATTPFKAMLADLLAGCGAKRVVDIRTKKGDDYQQFLQTVRFRNGDIRYVGILKQPANSNGKIQAADYVPVEINFGAEGHVYDVRAGKYLGKTGKIEAEIAPAVAKLYAILPYEVKGLDLSSGGACPAGGTVKIPVAVKTAGGPAGTHVVHVEAFGPDKTARGYYARNIKLEKGSGVLEIGTALNDEKGKWEIVVKDLASGAIAKGGFEIK